MTRDPTTRFLTLATTGMAVAMLALVGFIGYDMACNTDIPLDGEGADDLSSCDEESYEQQCADGYVCKSGRCEVDDEVTICAEGEPAIDCACPPELEFKGGRCVAPNSPTPEVREICRQPEVRDAIEHLIAQCKSRGKTIENCTPDDLKEFILDGEQFDTLLSAFPDRFTLHFDRNYPSADDLDAWSADEAEYVVGELERHRESLERARHVIMVGRSSRTGNSADNYLLALRRVDLTTKYLLASFPDQATRGRGLRTKLLNFHLGEAKQIKPSLFRQYYARDNIGWNRKISARMKRGLGPRTKISAYEKNWLYNTINRTVIVIPIPCDKRDYQAIDAASPAATPRPRVTRDADADKEQLG